MIREQRASGAAYDGTLDVYRVTCESSQKTGIGKKETLEVTLLLDTSRRLQGVDLGGEGFQRLVIMLGTHESVSEQKPARADVTRAADGDVLEVAISAPRSLFTF